MYKSILLAAFLVSACAAFDKDGDVLVLTDADIEDAIKQNEFILIEFYAPWCGHCKNLAPEYAKAATTLSKLDKPIFIAKVDATEEKEYASKIGVRGYPTIKWFVNGEMSDYNGGRTAAEIVSWIKKKTGPALKSLQDQQAIDAFKASADVVVIGFVSQDSEEGKALEGAARASESIEYGIASEELATAAGLSFPSIALFKNFDDNQVVFDGEFKSDVIGKFVTGNSVPLVSVFSQESAPKIFGSGIETHFLYFNQESNSNHNDIMGELRNVAKEFKGKTLFVYVPATEERVMSYFGFKAADLPKSILVALGEGDMKKFGFDGELTADAIRAHVASYHAGSLKPTLKSEEIPEDNNGPVKVLVGKNFNEIALDTTKDVFVEFYAPWCGHCKSLAPVWDKLGQRFASSSSVVIAKMDATANDIDHPAVSVRGFPTLIFFPANGKDAPVSYNGERDLESLAKFVEEKAAAHDDHAGHAHPHEDL